MNHIRHFLVPTALITGLYTAKYNHTQTLTDRLINTFDEGEFFSRDPFHDTLDKELKRISSRIKRSFFAGQKVRYSELKIKKYAASYRHQRLSSIEPTSEMKEALFEALSNENRHKEHRSEFLAYQVDQLCRYPKVAKKILNSPYHRKKFYRWAIVERHSVEVFVKFPALAHKLTTCNLSKRISAYGGTLHPHYPLQIDGTDVTLKMNFQDVSILDESRVIEFENSFSLSVGDIFKVFKEKLSSPGNLEFFEEGGIRNWNSHKRSRWSPETHNNLSCPLDPNNPFKDFPITRILTTSSLTKEFQLDQEPDSDWVFSIRASKQDEQTDLINNHASFEVAIPINDGYYALYNFGFYIKEFPGTLSGFLKILGNTVIGTIAYPDETNFQPEREHIRYARILDQEETARLKKVILEEFTASDLNNLCFQIESENCAKEAQKIAERVWGDQCPNFFKTNIFEVQAPGLLGKTLRTIAFLPEPIRLLALRVIHKPFFPARGTTILEGDKKVWKSLQTSEFLNSGTVYIPSIMHDRVVNNRIVEDTQTSLKHG